MAQGSQGRSKKPAKPKIDKGKRRTKENDEYGHATVDELHMHRMSLITQIQDLFPDLGSAFVLKVLDEYNDDVEQVTAHLLEDSLPAHLKDLNRSDEVQVQPGVYESADAIAHLSPRNTPPLLPRRRNKYDDDAFDRLAISPAQIHRGRKGSEQTADVMLQDRSTAPNKAAILSALAAFDSDDDERDDTYDVADVGGTVDVAMPGSDEADADLLDNNEQALYNAYKMSPEVFDRDANTRRGKARAALKSETGMTDEAVEGWGIMIGRDSRRLRRLEAKFAMAAVGQPELARTSYREAPVGTDDSEQEGTNRRGGGIFRGRGRGGPGGPVAGPADDKGAQISRQRKEANKGSRANHNRRNQRARKMARGGFAG